MWKLVKEYVDTCDTCSRFKAPRHHPHGLLHPLPVPFKPWSSISMDFIVELPLSQGFDSILVVMDWFTKMAHFIPTTKTITGEGTAKLFLQHIYRYHGLSAAADDIISDRGPQFISSFWQSLFKLLGTQISLSLANHPQSVGRRTERVNQVLEQ